jgi:D-alanyl-D-alanine carboxypeptidase
MPERPRAGSASRRPVFHLTIRLLALVLGLASPAIADALPIGFPESQSQPAPAQQPTVTDLAEMLRPIRDQTGVPAVGAVLLDSNGIRAIGVDGVRVLRTEDQNPVPVAVDDLWHLGSCTKAMTATLVARITSRQDATIRFETRLGELLDQDLRRRMDPGWQGVTLLMLLQNRGGAPGNVDSDLWASLWRDRGAPVEQRARLAREVLRAAPSHKPGTVYEYSNSGYTLVGHAIEHVEGKAFEQLLLDEVFAPLGITSAGFGAPGVRDVVDQPRGHREAEENGSIRYTPVRPGPNADNPAAIAPAGRVHMSLADWARFVRLHLRGARGEAVDGFLPLDAFQTLHRPALESYAAGWIVVERAWTEGPVLTHSGSNTMWYAVVWIAPGTDAAFLAVCNAGGERAAQACDAIVTSLLPMVQDKER